MSDTFTMGETPKPPLPASTTGETPKPPLQASSRFSGAATYRRTLDGDDAPIEILRPRLGDAPPAVLQHTVQAGDRLDLLAFRYLGDPLQYWRIVDANPTLDPDDLLEVGRTLSIPRGG